MPRVSGVKEYPVVARVVSILISLHTSFSDTDLRGGIDTDDGWRFVGEAFAVLFNAVNERWYPSEVGDGVIFFERDWGKVIGGDKGEGVNGWHEMVSPSFHSIREQGVSLPIT